MLKETYLGSLVKLDITCRHMNSIDNRFIKVITLTFRKYMSGDKSK